MNKEIHELAKKLWTENEEVATELANVIFGIRDGDYETEIEYPIFKKSKNTGSVVMFTALTEGTIIIPNVYNPDPAGAHLDDFSEHTDEMLWQDVPYDRERGLYHGQAIYAWDNDYAYRRTCIFYDAINKCTFFANNGKLDGPVYDNYEAIPTEHIPEWMYDAYKTLEGI